MQVILVKTEISEADLGLLQHPRWSAPLTIITKRSILDVGTALDPPLNMVLLYLHQRFSQASCVHQTSFTEFIIIRVTIQISFLINKIFPTAQYDESSMFM